MDDIRLAGRRLRRSPSFTVAVVAILAAGIGVNTAMFSIVSGVLLRPLPFAAPEQLVSIGEARAGVVGDGLVSLPVYLSWREHQRAVAVAGYSPANWTLGGEDPIQVSGASVTGNFFALLGAPFALGRSFGAAEDDFGGPRSLVLSHALWQTRFGGDPNVIGRSLTIDGAHYQVVGIARADFEFPKGAQLWTPLLSNLGRDLVTIPTWKFITVVGRLGSSVTVERARRELAALTAAVPRNQEWGARVTPLRDRMTGDARGPLLILMAAVGVVLLIVCANVGNLLLARGAARTRELAVRAALGATRARIARELLAESLLLAGVAGVIGTLGAWWGLHALLGLSPTELPRVEEIGVDLRVLTFAFAASLFTGLATGMLPAMRSSSVDLSAALNDGAHASTGVAGRRLRASLVAAEIALSLALLTGAGLLIRSFIAIVSVDPGFRAEQVTAIELKPPPGRFTTWAPWHDFFSEVIIRVRSMPGVVSVATATNLPLSGVDRSLPIVVEHGAATPANRAAQISAASPGYFRTMGIPLLAGREFAPSDETGKVGVAIVNERFARTFFPGENPIGKKARPFFGGPTMREIIGVVADVHHTALTANADPIYYTLAAQATPGPLTVLVRSRLAPDALVPAVRAVLRTIDPGQPIGSVTTMEELLSRSVARPRFYATLLGVFAAMAIGLAVLGLYAVMGQLVAQRSHEMGIRRALGARGVDVFALLLGEGMKVVVIGMAIGLVCTIAAARLLSTLLFGVGATDSVAFLSVLALVGAAAATAISIQAWRATRLDIVHSLRN
jgi:putative ABC transport system permease protein